jgi:hypothetical protein
MAAVHHRMCSHGQGTRTRGDEGEELGSLSDSLVGDGGREGGDRAVGGGGGGDEVGVCLPSPVVYCQSITARKIRGCGFFSRAAKIRRNWGNHQHTVTQQLYPLKQQPKDEICWSERKMVKERF